MTTTTSLVQMSEESFQRFADRPLFGERVDGVWTWTSYREVGRAVAEIRAGLAALGVQRGDRVAVISRNSTEWAAIAYATYGLGATLVPMYEQQRREDWEFILRDCAAVVVLPRTAEIATAIATVRNGLPALQHVVTIDAEGAGIDEYTLDRLRALGRMKPIPPIAPDPDSIAGYVYTSGTTGRPKGAMLSHANIASNVAASTSVFPVTADDRTVSFLPWAHSYGQVVELHILVSSGASTAFNRDLAKLVDDLAAIRPTMLVAVPRIFNKIHSGVIAQIAEKPRPIRALFHRGIAASIRKRRGEKLGLGDRVFLWLANLLVFAKIRGKFGGRLKYAITGSATLSKDVAEFIDALGLDVYEGYGLTETSPVVSTNRPGERRLGSVGKPLPGVTVDIDESVGTIEGVGEIVVHGPNVMKGYHARPEENARAFSADGGLRTGDLGRFDADGYLYISGRIKEQYKLENGKYVTPTPLEERLAMSPYITTTMLVGADRPHNVALVAIDAARVRAWAADHGHTLGADLTQDREVHDLIEHELANNSGEFRSYERPHAFVITDDELTAANGMLTPTLKLKRANVLARYGAALEALYAPVVPIPPTDRGTRVARSYP